LHLIDAPLKTEFGRIVECNDESLLMPYNLTLWNDEVAAIAMYAEGT
jgi:hypothetical protein